MSQAEKCHVLFEYPLTVHPSKSLLYWFRNLISRFGNCLKIQSLLVITNRGYKEQILAVI